MEPRAKIPSVVILGIVLAIVLDTVVQISWKEAVLLVPDGASLVATAQNALLSPFFYLAMVAFAIQFVNWLRVLARADLSFAQPFTALSYITVLAISPFTVHEHVSVMRLLGVSLILVGVAFISRTSHSTTSGAITTPSTMGNGTNGG